ncbi:hypothetical protein AAG906_012907 [Vitis piasezkii]
MAAISASTTDSPIITINASTTINEKLTPSTFPQWRAQFEALLIGYDLIDFVTGVKKCPAIDATNSATSKAANSHWVCQDKLILHAILASTSTTITPLLAAYKTSHKAWTTLKLIYLTLSTRGTRITEFLHGIKVIADELAIINHSVLNDDLTSTFSMDWVLNLEKLRHPFLPPMENQSAATFVPTAHYSHYPKSSSNKTRNNNWHHKNGPSNSGHMKFKPKCQWCDQMGHTDKNCPKMSSPDFTANCAASSQGKNHKWLVDLATSHNMITDLSNLSINSEYDGTDEVVIGSDHGAILLKGECEDGVYPFSSIYHQTPKMSLPTFMNVLHPMDGTNDLVIHRQNWTFPFSNPKNPGSPSSVVEDPSVTISLPQLLLVPRGTTESPDVGIEVSPSLENGSSPTSTPLQVTLTDSRWRDAMSSKLTALMRHNTWQLVPPPNDCNIVGCKWARLVAKGFNQRPGLDYKETFSPIIKPVTIRTVLTLVVMQGWSLRQLDVNNAFLHGHLTKVYMKQPPGFRSPEKPNHVCCLTKAIYGLKQAPRAWYSALKRAPLEFGFINAKSDSSLFVFHDGSILVYCLVYVDDLILTGNNSTFVANGLFLTQHKYIRDILAKTSMDGAKDVTTPLSTSVSLQLANGLPSVDSTEYRRVIGALQYLSLTQPDISFAVNKLSHPTLTCFSDADWAGSLDDRKSTSAYVLFLGHTPISWSSKKQSAIARSSTEVEYRALAMAAAESMWLLSLFQEMKFTLPQPPLLLCDNLAILTCARLTAAARTSYKSISASVLVLERANCFGQPNPPLQRKEDSTKKASFNLFFLYVHLSPLLEGEISLLVRHSCIKAPKSNMWKPSEEQVDLAQFKPKLKQP